MTATKQIPISHVCFTDESHLKYFLVNKTLSQICSTDEDESKCIIVDKCSTEEYESEWFHKNINKQKDAKSDTEYEESQLQMKCRNILTYLNEGKIFWIELTWHMNKRAWPPNKKNTLRICWKIRLNNNGIKWFIELKVVI